MQNSIYQRIKILREMLNKEQIDFAKVLNLSQSGYSSLERGRTQFKLQQIEIISNHFGCDKNWILNGDPILSDDELPWESGPRIITRTEANAEYYEKISHDSTQKMDDFKKKYRQNTFRQVQSGELETLRSENSTLKDQVKQLMEMVNNLTNSINMLSNKLGKLEGNHLTYAENEGKIIPLSTVSVTQVAKKAA